MTATTTTKARILIGGAGAPNYGDELIVKGWLDLLDPVGTEGGNVILYENTVQISRDFHTPAGHPWAERVAFRNNLTLMAKAAEGLNFWEQVERGFTFMRDLGFSQHGYNGSRELFEAASFHLHGGGYFNDIRSDKAFILGIAASFAKIYGIPVFATGIGFGPIKAPCPDRARFEEILSYFDFFEARDDESFQQLTDLAPSARIVNGIDDSLLLPAHKVFRRDSSKRRLHISLIASHLPFIKPGFWAWLAAQSEAFDEVLFWESYAWNDRPVVEAVMASIPRCKVITTADLIHQLPPIGDDDVVVTHRFHVHFAAARAGARGFYIAPSTYYLQKHRSIAALGSMLNPFDFNNLPDLGDLPPVLPLDEVGLRRRKLELPTNYPLTAPLVTSPP